MLHLLPELPRRLDGHWHLVPEAQLQCQKPNYNRGVGTVITTCDPPLEESGLLCYPSCEDGFHGVGPGDMRPARDFSYFDMLLHNVIRARDVVCVLLSPIHVSHIYKTACYCMPSIRNSLLVLFYLRAVCWSTCGGTTSYNCLAGCATDESACGKSVFEMIESVFQVGVDFVLLVWKRVHMLSLFASFLRSLSPSLFLSLSLARYSRTYTHTHAHIATHTHTHTHTSTFAQLVTL